MAAKVSKQDEQESLPNGIKPFSGCRSLCNHYSRACSLVSACCKKVYPCRHCHDDKESHTINRFEVTEVVCRQCSLQQPVAESCVKCSIRFASYYCSVCRLYDDTEKGQFHCEGCGICRIGGKSNFFHCDRCGLCLPISMKESHTCVQDASHSNCPVCMEDIHSSRDPAHIPKCGHLLHMACYQDMAKNGLYQCPLCQISLIDMTSHWRSMDQELQRWILPPQLKEFKVKILCRDCQKESQTPFHFIGLKCLNCFSYNTYRTGSEEMPLEDVDATAIRTLDDEEDDDEEEEDDESDSGSFATPPSEDMEMFAHGLHNMLMGDNEPMLHHIEHLFGLPQYFDHPLPSILDLDPAFPLMLDESSEEDEHEGEANGGTMSDGWETSSEEELVGGDEEDLGQRKVMDNVTSNSQSPPSPPPQLSSTPPPR